MNYFSHGLLLLIFMNMIDGVQTNSAIKKTFFQRYVEKTTLKKNPVIAYFGFCSFKRF